ncbi:MAG: NAD(P)-binding domain-containing protein, partial [Holosporaceae bacterium]|nr:NAD(P)-binding domain-containing protein [Holosporaceae bacterium]
MNILLIGCGNIGRALLDVWVVNGTANRIVVLQPSMSRAKDFASYEFVTFVDNAENIPKDFLPDIVVLVVKPQTIDSV